jgi:hypothetical protein
VRVDHVEPTCVEYPAGGAVDRRRDSCASPTTPRWLQGVCCHVDVHVGSGRRYAVQNCERGDVICAVSASEFRRNEEAPDVTGAIDAADLVVQPQSGGAERRSDARCHGSDRFSRASQSDGIGFASPYAGASMMLAPRATMSATTVVASSRAESAAEVMQYGVRNLHAVSYGSRTAPSAPAGWPRDAQPARLVRGSEDQLRWTKP